MADGIRPPKDENSARGESVRDIRWETALAPTKSAGASDAEISRQLSVGTLILACLAVVPSVLLCFWAAHAFDAFAESHDRTLLSRALDEVMEDLVGEQEGVTIWDDAVVQTRARNQAWMDDNIGIWMHDFYGHDQVFVLDGDDRPVLSVVSGANRESGTFEAVADLVLPLAEALREELPNAEAPGELGTQDLGLVSGHPAAISVKPIVPSTEAVALAPDDTYLHVSILFLDGPRLQSLGEDLLVTGARFVPLGAPGAVRNPIPLVSKAFGVLGHVTWTPSAPGQGVIRAIAPGIAISILALMALIVWLVRRLQRALTQIRENKAEVQHLAFHDVLTGLPNRALFDDRLDQALALVRRGEGHIALHYIDLDRFKYVNDTFGHTAGDELIRDVGRRLTGITRESDTVARLGGDEFVILQTGVRGVGSAKRLATRILEKLRQPYRLGGDMVFAGASVGIAISPDCSTDRSELMRKADIALYQAKSGGKDRFCVFEDSFDEMVRLRRSVETDLRSALDTGEGLSIVYQPFYAPDGKTVCGAEALFRWDHPRHKTLSPGDLISIADERGLASELGCWILRQATRAAQRVDLPLLSVNVSAPHFQDRAFPDHITDILAETGFPPDRLQLEIKERLLREEADAIAPMVEGLRSKGIRLALDEFGSGYSSFRYLHHLRIDGIKIDRTFIQAMEDDSSTATMVRVMLDLARAFEISVVAGGIETESQWEALRRLGTPYLQGFLFSRPLCEDQLSELLTGCEKATARRVATRR
ncbi:MAG: EAL domain-containing protein [Pseudomonadota bacterium]